jgi:predicted amidohydrolase
MVRIALANLPYPGSPDQSIALAVDAVASAGRAGARVVCFPECYVPGYRGLGHAPPAPDAAFLERAWDTIARAAAAGVIAIVLGTERLVEGGWCRRRW